jgi:hypothetical protein
MAGTHEAGLGLRFTLSWPAIKGMHHIEWASLSARVGPPIPRQTEPTMLGDKDVQLLLNKAPDDAVSSGTRYWLFRCRSARLAAKLAYPVPASPVTAASW